MPARIHTESLVCHVFTILSLSHRLGLLVAFVPPREWGFGGPPQELQLLSTSSSCRFRAFWGSAGKTWEKVEKCLLFRNDVAEDSGRICVAAFCKLALPLRLDMSACGRFCVWGRMSSSAFPNSYSQYFDEVKLEIDHCLLGLMPHMVTVGLHVAHFESVYAPHERLVINRTGNEPQAHGEADEFPQASTTCPNGQSLLASTSLAPGCTMRHHRSKLLLEGHLWCTYEANLLM